ncbi:GNAT family N-acetyltransferase [Vibrio hippocampi]|uniref:Protein ElaA n=1 Tax=Vibrio hippocampi TaxID=654686 RepID=A0ABM8ZET0_9VIBR|nr:GNAT family N-acetyltransferase [Vibrio hippocampi]CAH0524523.1 Protein ElaA [Vibrio hippocampi]
MIEWKLKLFEQLSTTELYQLLKLRVDVFVVEQNCPYPELDNNDDKPGVHHLLGYDGRTLVACARLLPKGITYQQVSIGRVATSHSRRGEGLGHLLIQTATEECQKLWPNEEIKIGAQFHLQDYYGRHGFIACSEEYLEDDIPHIDMKLKG